MKTTTKIIFAALAVGAVTAPMVCKKLHNNKISRLKAAEESMQLTDEEAAAIDAAVRKCHCVGDGAYDQCSKSSDDVEIEYETKNYFDPIALDDDTNAIKVSFDGKDFKDAEGNLLDKDALKKLFEDSSCVSLDISEALNDHNISIDDFVIGLFTYNDESSNDFHSLLINYFNSKKENAENEDQKNS